MSQIQNRKILNFSSSQQKGDFLLSSTNNNLYTNKNLISYIKNSRNKIQYNPQSKTNNLNNNINKYQAKNILSKTFELESNKKDDKDSPEIQKSTSKIDYRHYKKYPIKEIFPLKKLDGEKEKLYWLVTYDKLIKAKNIVKILNYNIIDDNKNQINSKPIYTESSLKIKTMKISQFEIFFVKGYDKPFVRPNGNKNSFILAKLYLLTNKEINKIINFINRTDDKINIEKYKSITKRDLFQYIGTNKNYDINLNINYPYCYIYYLGKFMNISMYLFTNSFDYIQENNINNNLIYSLPSSKKLYKLIKIIIKSFPEYNPEYIINNIIKYDLYSNSKEKKYEIFKYLSILKHSKPNKNLLNKVLRETITGIQTNSSISVSSPPFDSSEGVKTSERYQKNPKIPIAKQSSDENKNSLPPTYHFEFKSSLNSMNNFFLNGQLATNYLSTTHTMLPSNSIKTYSNKNSKSNIPLKTIPYEINNLKRDTFGNYYAANKNLIKGINLIPKKNIEEKKISNKNIINKLKNIEDKENININNILNKKKEENAFYSKKNIENNNIIKDNNKNISNNNDILYKKKKNEKRKNNKDDKNEYTTPKKRKKIRYYK